MSDALVAMTSTTRTDVGAQVEIILLLVLSPETNTASSIKTVDEFTFTLHRTLPLSIPPFVQPPPPPSVAMFAKTLLLSTLAATAAAQTYNTTYATGLLKYLNDNGFT